MLASVFFSGGPLHWIDFCTVHSFPERHGSSAQDSLNRCLQHGKGSFSVSALMDAPPECKDGIGRQRAEGLYRSP